MDYYKSKGQTLPDSWNVTRPINAEEAEIYGIETGFNWEFYPAWNLVLITHGQKQRLKILS